MSSGFNTDVQAGGRLFHIQTEDRGPHPHVIDTAVYHHGMVLYRHSRNYEHFAKSPEFSAADLRERVEEQHRSVIEDIQSGILDTELAAAMEKGVRAAGIQVQLLNPKSWLSGNGVSLELEILRRADHQPEQGVQVEAAIEGASQDIPHIGRSDERGRVQLQFSLPLLGNDDLTLVIQARNDSSKDEIRFAMRVKPKAPPADAAR
jgi:hypothetical protein